MFVILLKFSENKANAAEFMEGHKAWINQGLEDGVFLVVGSLQPQQGGAIIANNATSEQIESRVLEDPFVAEKVVTHEILEINPNMAAENLQFLLS